MIPALSRGLWVAVVGAGVALTIFGQVSLESNNRLATDQNPMAIRRAAYGKMLARLSETTVDRVWHLGIEQVAPHDHGPGGHDHGHSRGDHGHSRGDHGHSRGDHGHSRGDHGHAPGTLVHARDSHDDPTPHRHSQQRDEPASIDDALPVNDEDPPADVATNSANEQGLDRLKGYLQGMKLAKYARTNPYSLSTAHRAQVAQDIQQMLLRSYNMDPTHYGAYSSYHLFLTTHEFGGTKATRAHAKQIAQITMEAVRTESENPEPWITAAAAAMNLYQLDTEKYVVAGKPIPIEILREYRDKVGYCIYQFDTLFLNATENGNWDNLSTERQYEIATRARFMNNIFEPFDVMIARA